MVLCEENFVLLGRLVPQLDSRCGCQVSRGNGGVDLHLKIEEQSRYTTLLRLTYVFDADGQGGISRPGLDPDAYLRAYHDARQVELIELRQTALPRHANYCPPALESNWRLNLFLSKWLSFCLLQGHCFGPESQVVLAPHGDELAFTLT